MHDETHSASVIVIPVPPAAAPAPIGHYVMNMYGLWYCNSCYYNSSSYFYYRSEGFGDSMQGKSDKLHDTDKGLMFVLYL